MPSLIEQIKNTPRPWFLKKKALIVILIIVGVAFIGGCIISWGMYQEKLDGHRHYTTKRILEPLWMLPAIIGMIYAIIVMLWMIIKLREFRNRMFSRIPDMFKTQEVKLHVGENVFCSEPMITRNSPGTIPKVGQLRITDQRIIHTSTVSAKRVGVLVGLDEPDVSFSIPWNEVHQCGFGLHDNKNDRFVVITTSGAEHKFGPVYAKLNVANAMSKLGWKKTEAGEMMYWFR
jgi:hypothetical protein